jgi:hypothetical protein
VKQTFLVVSVCAVLAGCGGGMSDGGGASGGSSGTTGAGGVVGSGGNGTGGASGLGGSPTGSGGTSSATGGSNGTGGATQLACRTYASAYTFASSEGAVYDYACADSQTSSGFQLECTLTGDTVDLYKDKGAFIDEGAAVGLIREQSSIYNGAYEYDYKYDAQNRLLEIDTSGYPYGTFDMWDSLGRPLHEVMGGSCAGGDTSYEYDDAARTRTITTVGGSCATWNKFHYDQNMILTFLEYPNGVSATYTTTSTATVCR